ncbi:MAG: four helix bundle protein [Rickettsiales bacterium]
MTILSYQDLDVWKKSRLLVKEVYLATQDFPKTEIYALTQQIQRAAISIPSNIAEGRCRSSKKEFTYHLRVATGSLAELETQLILACDLQFLSREKLEELTHKTAEISRMLNGLLRSLEPETRNLEPVDA